MVVDAAGSRQGFAELLREGEVLQGRREAPKAVVLPAPSPLYIGPLGGGGAGQDLSMGGGGGQGGGTYPPSQVGRPPTLGFPTLGAGECDARVIKLQ